MTTIISGSASLQAYCDTYRKDRSGSSIALLSIYGDTTMVRGITAHAMTKGFLRVHGYSSYATLSKDESYSTLTQSIGDGLSHTVIIDRRATNVSASWDKTLFVVADSESLAKSTWVGRFGRRCKVPIKNEWGARLWDIGVKNSLIDTCEGFGLGTWYVAMDNTRWQEVISESILNGDLDG